MTERDMSMTPKATGRLLLLLVVVLFSGATVVAQEPPAPPPATQETPAEPPATQEATAEQPTMSCGDCHDQAKDFLHNPHARGNVENGVVSNGACETCHGDGTAHMEGGGDKTQITVPRGREGADGTCLMCHDTTTHKKSTRSGVHANTAAVNCLSCHSIHKSEDRPALLAKETEALCSTCHSTQVAAFRGKPFAHRLGHGGMSCISCHEPHSRAGRENIRTVASGEAACASCHREKHGPFVFEHGAVSAGDCSSCHEPHGSTNAHQLKRATVAQLCLECHSPTQMATAGSQPPSFHNISNPRFQNCTTCHVAVHGSNRSPQLLK